MGRFEIGWGGLEDQAQDGGGVAGGGILRGSFGHEKFV